jgi:hypothetical protein
VSDERYFGGQKDSHPPMRGLEGDFTEQDEADLVRLATLTSAALDGLAQLYLAECRDKIGT